MLQIPSWIGVCKMKHSLFKHISSWRIGSLFAGGVLLLCLFMGEPLRAENAPSPYINKVYQFLPAPGQFTNLMPAYEEGDDAEAMRKKAEEALADNAQGVVSLGAWGGYIVFGFDHMVENRPTMLDLSILGNAFAADNEHPENGGSSEPGVVWVSYDANANGLPDDAWYEIAGSEYGKPETRQAYGLTYYRPAKAHVATPDPVNKYLLDTTYVKWRDKDGDSGYIMKNSFHQQDYFPEWIETDSLVFYGTRLKDNYQQQSENYYLQYPYLYGYADNYPNTHIRSKINIDWAVDETGESVHLPGIHFVRVATGVLQNCGMIGESSTEIKGAYDLHLTGEAEEDRLKDKGDALPQIDSQNGNGILNRFVSDRLIITSRSAEPVQVWDVGGQLMLSTHAQTGTTVLPCSQLGKGIYIIKIGNTTSKFIKY